MRFEIFRTERGTLARNALATELALTAHRAFNLSKLTLRITFARYALSAKAGRRAEPQAADSPSEEEKSKNLCDKTRLLMVSTQSLGDFSTSTKRGLRSYIL